MMLSGSVSNRHQMDLIEMPVFEGYRYILRVVDHLSLYGFVAPIKNRTAEEVGNNLIRILSSAIVPQILQSDNGSEVHISVSG